MSVRHKSDFTTAARLTNLSATGFGLTARRLATGLLQYSAALLSRVGSRSV